MEGDIKIGTCQNIQLLGVDTYESTRRIRSGWTGRVEPTFNEIFITINPKSEEGVAGSDLIKIPTFSPVLNSEHCSHSSGHNYLK